MHEFLAYAPNRDKKTIEQTLETLAKRYSEPHRHYHNWSHIMRGWTEYKKLFDKPLTPIQAFAWLYHDAEYDPQRQDNEERSAVTFLRDSEALGFDSQAADAVMRLILSTIPSKNGKDVINDMDLCILGAELKPYLDYATAVRKEYSFVDDTLWKTGRMAVLKSFLRRKKLYVTTEFAAKFTHTAKRNMQVELDVLSGK